MVAGAGELEPASAAFPAQKQGAGSKVEHLGLVLLSQWEWDANIAGGELI